MSAPLAPERLAKYAALAQAATEGPWRREDDGPSLTRLVVSDDRTLDVSLGYVGNRTQDDAAFIAAARTAVPELLAEVERLTAELESAAKAPAELTVYRASHDSIVFGRYITPNAAWKHCEAYAEREFPAPFAAYWHADVDGTTELMISVHGSDDIATGYLVTPLTVDAAYDAEADE